MSDRCRHNMIREWCGVCTGHPMAGNYHTTGRGSMAGFMRADPRRRYRAIMVPGMPPIPQLHRTKLTTYTRQIFRELTK